MVGGGGGGCAAVSTTVIGGSEEEGALVLELLLALGDGELIAYALLVSVLSVWSLLRIQ